MRKLRWLVAFGSRWLLVLDIYAFVTNLFVEQTALCLVYLAASTGVIVANLVFAHRWFTQYVRESRRQFADSADHSPTTGLSGKRRNPGGFWTCS